MRLPEKEYYSLKEIARKWGWTVGDLLYEGTVARGLQLCVRVYGGYYIICEGAWSIELEQKKREHSPCTTFAGDREYLSGGVYPAYLLPGDWIPPGQLGPESLESEPITIQINGGYTFIDEFDRSGLFITREEKERYEAAHELAGNIKKKRRPGHRTRLNELWAVIWNAYLALSERHTNEPTSGEVWRHLKINYKKYDTEELIQEIKKETIYWTNFRGEEKSLKESSFKGTLSKIKAQKKSNKILN